MQVTAQRDTPGELAIRSALHRLGLRFSVDCRPLLDNRTRADIVFRSARIAIFVDGCFWHGCPKHGTWPKTNALWWRRKIESNRRRDANTGATLRRAGWVPIRVWAHEEPDRVAAKIERRIRTRLRP